MQRRRNGNAIDKRLRRTSSRVRARAPSATLFSSSRFAAAPKTLQGDKEGISASLMVTSTTCASPPPSSGRSRSPHSKPQVTLTQAAAKTDGHTCAAPWPWPPISSSSIHPSIHPSIQHIRAPLAKHVGGRRRRRSRHRKARGEKTRFTAAAAAPAGDDDDDDDDVVVAAAACRHMCSFLEIMALPLQCGVAHERHRRRRRG